MKNSKKVETQNEIPHHVDVVMCTWESNSPWFKRCLLSINRNIPIHCFILVDRKSKDETVKSVTEVFPNAKIYQTDDKLAQQRKIGIKMVDTEWFLFCDDDIEFNKEWYANVTKHIENDVGAINGLAVPTDNAIEKFFELRIKDRILQTRKTSANKDKPNEVRGLTGNTLIRTRLAKDWNPPRFLSAYEDHHLLCHVVKNGYSWITVHDATVRHYGNFNCRSEITKAKWNAAAGRLIGALDLKTLVQKAFFGIGMGLVASVKIGNPRILLLLASMHFGYIVGYLEWDSYLGPYPRTRKAQSFARQEVNNR